MSEKCNYSPAKIEEISDEEAKLLKLQPSPKKIVPSADSIGKKIVEIPIGSNEVKRTIINDSEYLIYHPPRYTPPAYRDPKLAPLSLREQVKFICSYHVLISRSIANQAKIQIDSCSYPEPIEPVQKKNINSAQKKEDGEYEECKETYGSGDKSDEYVSRAGRITKRKFYSEVDERKKDSITSPKGNGEDEIPTKRKAPLPPSRNKNLRQRQLNKVDSPEAETDSKKKGVSKISSPSAIPKQQKRSSDGFVEPVAPGSNKRSTRKTIECPICLKHFPEKEVEQHASSCGEMAMDVGNTSNSSVNGFRCHSCRKVMISEEDYAIHCSTCNGGPSYLN